MREVLLVSALCACRVAGDPEVLLAADPARAGRDGEDGPYGAARVIIRAPARVTGVVLVRIVYPIDEREEPAVEDAPAVVLVHGGRVDPERYEWLAIHLASRGMAVALPEAVLDLALLEPGNGEIALETLRERSEPGALLANLVAQSGPAAVIGHSLGGVAAALQWRGDPSLEGLVLLASFAAGSGPIDDPNERPVLALGGTEDERMDIAALPEQIDRFSGPHWLGFVQGMNHYSWTDDPTRGELRGDGPLNGNLGELRQNAQRVIDVYLDATLDGGNLQALEQPAPGIEWAP